MNSVDSEGIHAEMENLETEPCELTNSWSTTAADFCNSEQDKNGTVSTHAELYKIRKAPMSQKDRREKLLQEMKRRRSTAIDDKRGLLELLDAEDDMEDLESEESMDVLPTFQRHRQKSYIRSYKQLMLSEWFTEIPMDLETNWLVKLCPVGHRNLVVAKNHITKAFSLRGRLEKTFHSDLPCGNSKPNNTGRLAVLDCIYNKLLQCYFVLDIIAWKNNYFADCETDFRFYLLKSKLEESPQLQERNALNRYPFIEVPYFPATLSRIQEELSHPYRINNQEPLLDGVLFYHRATHYIKKVNPLYGWLKPFMVPEMLHVPVDEGFMQFMPENYETLQQFLSKVSSKPKRIKFNASTKANTAKAEDMEAEPIIQDVV